MKNMLFVGKDELFFEGLSEHVKLYGGCRDIDSVKCSSSALNKLQENKIDALLVDNKLDDMDGISFIKDLRKKRINIPVFLFLSEAAAKKQNIDKMKVVGASKVYCKPFCLSSFLGNINSTLNLHENSKLGYIEYGCFILKPSSKELSTKDERSKIKLTEKEISIIRYLYQLNGKEVGKEELLKKVWGYSPDVSTHTLETHIYRLRKKIEKTFGKEEMIETVEGGYKLAM